MASLSIETRRVDELATTTTGSGEDDLLIIRLADGTGTKSIKVKDLRAVLVGDYSTRIIPTYVGSTPRSFRN